MSLTLSKFFNFKTISFFCLIVFILDRILKYLAVAQKIFYLKNFGLALSVSLPENLFLYFYILIFLILLLIVWRLSIAIQKNSLLLITSYWLLITGCASNLLDRLKFGFIIDYLNFYFFYNNLADIAICLGVILLIFNFFYHIDRT